MSELQKTQEKIKALELFEVLECEIKEKRSERKKEINEDRVERRSKERKNRESEGQASFPRERKSLRFFEEVIADDYAKAEKREGHMPRNHMPNKKVTCESEERKTPKDLIIYIKKKIQSFFEIDYSQEGEGYDHDFMAEHRSP